MHLPRTRETTKVRTISARKEEHVEICLNHDVSFREISAGFDSIQLMHCALPELNFHDVNTKVEFLSKTLYFPLMITGMTGGFEGAENANRKLAQVCQEKRIALGLGSQRQALENSDHHRSFSVVREGKLDIPVVGNIGAAQVRRGSHLDHVRKMVAMIEADALAIHLNPLQEVLQPEGDTDFTGVLQGIEILAKKLEVPIIVKETGAGISREVAEKLVAAGVQYIDVSGAGGTSWAAVEYYRGANQNQAQRFWDWGIPTVLCLREVCRVKDARVIASGGIRSGIDMAKAMALGAELTGAALPMLAALYAREEDSLTRLIDDWHLEFKTAMFLTGCKKVTDLNNVRVFSKKELR